MSAQSGTAPATVSGRRSFSARNVIKGFALLATGSILSQAIGFAALIVAARRLGPGNLGPYNFAVGVTQYFTLAADFGVSLLAIRDIAREPERAREIMGEALVLLLGIGAVVFTILVVLAPVLAPDAKSRALLPVAGVLMLATNVVALTWALRAIQRLQSVALTQLAGQAVYGALVPVFVGGGLAGALTFAWLHVVGAGITAVLAFVWVWRTMGLPRVAVHPRRVLRRLWLSLPIGTSFAMIQVYYSIDSIMLGYMRGTSSVGQYGVAYRLPLAVIGFASLWVAALYPHASALFTRDPERLRSQVERFTGLALLVALPLGVGVTIAGSGLMPQLFGAHFAPAGTPFVILVWAAAIIIVSVNFGNTLLACGDERRYAIGVTAGALVNVATNFALIPVFGIVGAAADTVAAESVVLVYMVLRFRRVLGPIRPEWQRISRIAGATAVMAAAMLLLRLPTSLAWIAFGAVVYVGAALALGAISVGEVRTLLKHREPPVEVPRQ